MLVYRPVPVPQTPICHGIGLEGGVLHGADPESPRQEAADGPLPEGPGPVRCPPRLQPAGLDGQGKVGRRLSVK